MGRTPGEADLGHSERIIDALIRAAAEKGYAATTISDIVRYAAVSRRTFYQLFADKEACLLAAFDQRAELLLSLVGEAASRHQRWDDRLRAGVDIYLRAFASDPAASRVLFIDIPAAGPPFLARRRKVFDQFAVALRQLVAAARAEDPEFRAVTRDLSPLMASAIVGAIYELVCITLEEERYDELHELSDPAADIFLSIVSDTVAERLRPAPEPVEVGG